MRRSFVGLITNVADFIPIVGSLKMIAEGIFGKQLGTEIPLVGRSRLVHLSGGLVFLFLDLSSVGLIISELGKGGIKIGEKFFFTKVKRKLSSKTLHEEGSKLLARSVERNEKQKLIRKSSGL
jgi:hypothetical protein